MSVTPKHRSRTPPAQGLTPRPRIRAIKSASKWHWLLHLVLAVPLVAFLFGMLLRDLCQEPPPVAVTVVVQRRPEEITRPATPMLPTYKVQVMDEAPEFNPALAVPQPVSVTIVDEREERPPVKVLPVKVEIRDEDDGLRTFVAGAHVASPVAFAIDPRPRLAWQYGPGMRFGILAVETGKRLTYAANGSTNQTLLRVNGQEGEFGGPMGRFIQRDVRLPPNPTLKTFGGSKSVWVSGKIAYTQILELAASKQPYPVNGQQKLLLDTVRVRYIVENRDTKPYKVGLRTQMDTLIGANDGVPFTVPGLSGMVTNFADFPKLAAIPDFIQALERPNLQSPGTVAHMSLKVGGGIKAPTRVSLTHWPGGGFPNWEVPIAPIAGDSAVVLYWNERALAPGATREMGFAYGLGSVASNDPGGRLGITLGGSFEPGESFTVTAYVQGPQKGQTLTLDLPRGLERIEGNETQKVLPQAPGASSSIVTWQVKVNETGIFPLKVASSNGLSQGKTISIARPNGAPELWLSMDLAGSFEPGEEFSVDAKLHSTGAVPQSVPLLTLPKGLAKIAGPFIKDGGSVNTATWKAKVLEPGKHAVRVEWSGAAMTKTLSIVRPEMTTGGHFSMRLDPPFAPGKAFGITAMVSEPQPGQTLTVQLPPGVRLVRGQEVMAVPRGPDSGTVVNWLVMVDSPGTFPLRVTSSAGLTQKKTVVIEKPERKGGDFKLDHLGEIAPGKEFTVRATVSDPVVGQKLTLMPLHEGLELVEDAPEKAVPANGKVTWRVRVLTMGVLPVRVASNTGVVQAFTITLTVEQPAANGQRIFGGDR